VAARLTGPRPCAWPAPALVLARACGRQCGGAAHRPPPAPGRVGGRKLKEGGRRKLLSVGGWEEMLRERGRR